MSKVINEQRKRWLKRQALKEKLKNIFIGILAVIFCIGIVITFLKDCVGIFFYSTENPPERIYDPTQRGNK